MNENENEKCSNKLIYGVLLHPLDAAPNMWLGSDCVYKNSPEVVPRDSVVFETEEGAQRALCRHVAEHGGGGSVVPLALVPRLSQATRLTWAEKW